MMKKYSCVLLLVFVGFDVFAQTPDDAEKNAYCQYVSTAAEAEKTLDTGVEAVGGVGQWSSDSNTTQAELGIRKSLSRHLQGNAAVRLAALECELYDKRLDVARVVKYRMSFIDDQVARQRISDLADVLGIVDEELSAMRKREYAHDATTADVLALTQRRADLFEKYLDAKASVASADFPSLPDGDPEKALIEVNDLALRAQEERNRKAALQTWDVSVGGGVRKVLAGGVDGSAKTYRPFATVNLTYNFNARAYRRKLDDSATAFVTLSRSQDDELTHQVEILKKRIAANLAEQEDLLPQCEKMTNYWNAQLQRLTALSSPDALQIRAQVRINLALAAMNEHLARFHIALLRSGDAPHK